MRFVFAMGLLAVVLVSCAAPPPPAPPPPPAGVTKVKFVMPEGSTVTVDGLTPSPDSGVYKFERPGNVDEVKETHVSFSFKLQTPGKMVTADGTIQVRGYQSTEMDEKAVSFCEITSDQVQKLSEGYAIAFDGFSPSKKPVYHMVIGLR